MTVAQGTPSLIQRLEMIADHIDHRNSHFIEFGDAVQIRCAIAELERLSAQVVELQKENAELANYKFMYESCSK